MSGETHQILLFFILVFSTCSFGLFTLSTVGGKWFACRSTQHVYKSGQYDLIFTLWEYCERKPSGGYRCADIDGASQFKEVLLDFKVLRILCIGSMATSGVLILISLCLCLLKERKIFRRIVVLLCVLAAKTVVLGISTIVYAAARGQDIVGLDVRFTFGWSCVTSWIATIVALLNTIITLVMICVYIDKLTERVNRVREDLSMDNLSIRSSSLQRINEHLDREEEDSDLENEQIQNINELTENVNEATKTSVEESGFEENEQIQNINELKENSNEQTHQAISCHETHTPLRTS